MMDILVLLLKLYLAIPVLIFIRMAMMSILAPFTCELEFLALALVATQLLLPMGLMALIRQGRLRSWLIISKLRIG